MLHEQQLHAGKFISRRAEKISCGKLNNVLTYISRIFSMISVTKEHCEAPPLLQNKIIIRNFIIFIFSINLYY